MANCTQATHDAATATRELFVANTINRKPWRDAEYDIDAEQGDCPKCGSSLNWDFIAERAVMRIAAALDHLHGEYDLAASPAITGAQWAAAFAAVGAAPNFHEGGRDVGVTDNLLHREPLMEAAAEQFAQLDLDEWKSLGL